MVHQPDVALRMVVALRRYWEGTDQRRSGISWSEAALASTAEPARLRVQALISTATLIAPWDSRRLTDLAMEADNLARHVGGDQLAAQAAVCRGEAKAFALDPADLQTREQIAPT
jgi:hypothetical protein